MGFLFPINQVSKVKPETEKMPFVEKIGDEEKQFNQNQKGHEEGFDQLEEKVNKLVNDKKLMEALDLSQFDNKVKSKLLEIAKRAASSFLRKELLNIARSILSISVNPQIDDDIDEEDLSFADQLARLVMKLVSNTKGSNMEKSVASKIGKTNPLEDKNAGFLVHYCKDILNKKIKQQKNNFKSEKLNKKDIGKYLKK